MSQPPEAIPETSAPAAPAATGLENQAAAGRRKENRRVLIMVLAVAAFMVTARYTPLRSWITNVQAWKDYVDTLGWLAHGGFTLACAAAVCIGVPRLPLCATAGLIFGFGEGLVLSLLGSTLGSYGAFLLARGGARQALVTRAERWPWLSGLLREPSLMRVFWVRQLMLPGMVLNVMLGITGVAHRTFVLGTLLGYLPLNIAFTLVGSGLGKANLLNTMMQLCIALAVVNLAGWLVWRWVRRQRAISG
jgi:uncharacterized membrane protein YdjX (TVP38/TMEM64 family)